MASVKDRLAARRASETGGKGKSLSKSAVQKVMSEAQSARDKGVKDASFSDLAKLEKQTQVKYDRGADLQKYIDKQAMYQDAISKGATTFVGPDGIERLNLAGTGITTPEGATVLSMFKPGITAIAPTGKQLMGDMGRSLFSGYNTLSYDPNAVGTPSTTGGTISRVPGLVPNIVNKYITGDLGIVGIAKNLYNKFTKTAADAKQFLGNQIDKLSDIDLERYKNKDQYKLTSQSPELQKIYQLEADELSARNTRDILGSRINEAISYGPSVPAPGQITIEEQVSTPVTSKVGGADLSVASSLGNRFGSTPVPNIIQQATTPDQLRLALLNQSYGMPDTEKPYLQQQDDYYYQDKERLSPKGDPYLYAANGGTVDQKLNNIQKKTNNIYGTGILSVR